MAAATVMASPNKRLRTGDSSEVMIFNSIINSGTYPVTDEETSLVQKVVKAKEAKMPSPNSPTTKAILVEPSENIHAGHDVVGHGLDMDEIDRSMFFTPSERQTVSCGTVTVDLKRGRVLSLWNKRLGIAQLPKGRKQIGEDHLDAGLRETFEESGVRAKPLALKVGTRSHPVPGAAGSPTSSTTTPEADAVTTSTPNTMDGATPTSTCPSQRIPDSDITFDVLNNEFLGVTQHPDPQSQTPDTLKSIYWFAATFDLDHVVASLDGCAGENLLGEEKFVVCAYGIRDTIEHLRFEAEKEVVRKLIADLVASGIQLGPDPSCGAGGGNGIAGGRIAL